jgi:serine/threonine-protein kinase
MQLPESLNWILQVVLRIFMIAAVGFLSMILAIRFTIHGGEVTVPEVTELHAGDAQQRLAAHGLGIKIVDRMFSDFPVDTVIRQSPKAGEGMRRAQRVHVILSLGARAVTVPNVIGEGLRAARIGLLQAGLQLGYVSSFHADGAEADTVMLQDPPSTVGTTHSPRVNLLVSLGPPEAAYLMPDLAGVTLGEAEGRLAAAGLELGKVVLTPGPEDRRGAVVGQSVPRGSRVTAGTHVELQLGT